MNEKSIKNMKIHKMLKLLGLLISASLINSQSLKIANIESENFYQGKVALNKNGNCRLLELSKTQLVRGLSSENPTKIIKGHLGHSEKGTPLPEHLDLSTLTIYGIDENIVKGELNKLCKNADSLTEHRSLVARNIVFEPYTEVRELLKTGDPKNRIDIVFMGDGYQLAEKEKFFADIEYLVKKIFEGVTFETYFPVYNVWAVFVESKDSGITKGDVKKDTTFKLYRPGNELRAIYYPDEVIDVSSKYCNKTGLFACDYRVIIANDEFYGGVGGDIIISTSSKRSGSIVLNHEMGHTFAQVGDEYDNSYAYFGANSDEITNAQNVKWKHWIDGPLREERNIDRLLLYPWYDLSKGPYVANFTSDGTFNRWFYRIGISGAEIDGSISITIDNKEIPWTSPKTVDRVFHDYFNKESGFSAGQHTLKVSSLIPPKPGNPTRMLTSVNLHEYGSESQFQFEGEHYSLYPVWDDHHVKRYRPNNEFCVMRNMTSPHFCKVCKESLWLQYFSRLNLIDDLKISSITTSYGKTIRKIELKPLGFGPFRSDPTKYKDEKLIVRWFKNGIEQKHLEGKFGFYITKDGNECQTADWKVTLQLITKEVRKDPKNLLTSEKTFKA